MGLLSSIKSLVASDKEKTFSGRGWDTMEGMFPASFTPGWFQQGYTPGASKAFNPDVAAAISLYKRALMAVPTRHVKRTTDGAIIEILDSSALAEVVFRPNIYMTWAELIGVIVDGLLTKGEFACFVEEDGRGRQSTLHPLHDYQMVAAVDGSIFYQLNFHDSIKYLGPEWSSWTDEEGRLYIPQRYVVHGRFEVDPRNPLKAMAPLHAYANSIGLGSVLRAGQEVFHTNKGQPSGVLTTDAALTAEQANRLRDRWNEMSQKIMQGQTPILSNGLRWQATSVSANESQVVQLLGFTTKDIAKAFGIPPILLGENSGVTYNNLEQLISGWRTTGLLSVCQIIEQAFEYSYKLPKDEEMMLDISDLARADLMNKADMLKGLVLNGIMKPNEARARLDLAPVAGVADELVSQAQVQPMQQNADQADDKNTRENALADAQIAQTEAQAVATEAQAAAPKPPKEEEEKPAPKTKEIDMESLDLMLKGVFNG
jgi:HK97 family phage portal protein